MKMLPEEEEAQHRWPGHPKRSRSTVDFGVDNDGN